MDSTATKFWTVLPPIGAHEVAGFAQRIEREGWDGLSVPDNQNLWGDTFVSMALAAAATDHLLVANGATNPATRHPAVMASVIAWVDQASQGRASLGIARGDSALAHLGMAPVSIPRFEAYVEVVKTYLRGDAVSFEALEPWRSSQKVTDLPMAEAPPESQFRWLPDTGPVPITMYVTGPRMIATAARLADRIMFVLGADDDRLAWAIGVARDACAAIGRDPKEVIFAAGMSVGVGDDVDLVRNMVSNTVASSARFSSMHGTVVGPVTDSDRAIYESISHGYDMNKHNAHGSQTALLTADFVDRFAVVGSAARCVERLNALRELGIDEFLIAPPYNDVDPVLAAKAYEGLIAEVLPAVRKG